jgi:mannosyltransferase
VSTPLLQNRPGISRGRWREPSAGVWTSAVGAAAFAVSFAANWVPSYWADEIATLQAARLTPAALQALLARRDAVHGLYDGLLHWWIAVLGPSEAATRLLSALAVGAAAAGVVAIGRRLGSLRLGVTAGIVFAALPRTTFMGAEARSYALSTAVVVWTVVVLLVCLEDDRARRWALYVVAVAVGADLFVYTLFLVPVHGALIASRHPARETWRHWAISVALGCFLASPVVLGAAGQRQQLAWLDGEPGVNAWSVTGEPWFDTSWGTALVAGVILAVGVVALVRRGRRRPGALLTIALAWAFVPAALLLLANQVAGPLYLARYLSFTTPAAALLLALVLVRVERRRIAALLLGSLLVISVPSYIGQRQPTALDGSDARQIADVVAAHARPGDAFLLQNDGPEATRPRLAVEGYPAAFAGLEDAAFVRSGIPSGSFAAVTRPAASIAWRELRVDSVWIATRAGSREAGAVADLLTDAGYVRTATYALGADDVSDFTR